MAQHYSDRRGWHRLVKTRFDTLRIDNDHFNGLVTLLRFDEFTAPFHAEYDPNLCLAAAGYSWLQHFPDSGGFAQTTAFDPEGQIVQWYIDLCGDWETGSDGVPFYEDLYLDIVIRPSGKLLVLDADELDEALSQGEINQETHQQVRQRAADLLRRIRRYEYTLLAQSRTHRDLLLEELQEE
jgi:uncharacterized protein